MTLGLMYDTTQNKIYLRMIYSTVTLADSKQKTDEEMVVFIIGVLLELVYWKPVEQIPFESCVREG